MSEPVHKLGIDAHGNEISDGIYAVRPDGNIVIAKPPLKPGWRAATVDDIEKMHDLEQQRRVREGKEQAAADAEARAESHERGELERDRQAENDERAAIKHEARMQNSRVLAEGDLGTAVVRKTVTQSTPQQHDDFGTSGVDLSVAQAISAQQGVRIRGSAAADSFAEASADVAEVAHDISSSSSPPASEPKSGEG